MKIAILTPTFFPYSGIDRVVEEEAESLGKNNDVTIFTFNASMKPKNAKLLILDMPKNPTLQRIYRLFFFLDTKKINKYTDKLKEFDKVISHQYPMDILAYKAKKRYNLHYTYYDAGFAYPHLFRKLIERIYMHLIIHLTKIYTNNADDAISISNFLKKELKRSTGLNSRVEYVKIDKKRFNKDILKKPQTITKVKQLKKKYNINGKVAICIGRISPHKGIDLLIKAFKKANVKDAKLLIIGKKTFSSYQKELNQLKNKNIIFTGFVPDEELSYYYALCNTYVTATLWEGYNMPVVEAENMGKKVIAFNHCSHPEVIKKGILVKPKDINSLAEAIIKVLGGH